MTGRCQRAWVVQRRNRDIDTVFGGLFVGQRSAAASAESAYHTLRGIVFDGIGALKLKILFVYAEPRNKCAAAGELATAAVTQANTKGVTGYLVPSITA